MKKNSKINMREIASIAKVSTATVSRVIHTPEMVKPETRQRVLVAMEKSKYVYNANAGDLSRRRSMVIGVTIPTTKDAGFVSSVMRIQEMALEKGYSVIIGNTKFDPKIELQILKQFQERNVSGIILTGFTSSQDEIVFNLIESGIHCVVMWETFDKDSISFVGFDNLKASRTMTEHLINLNHTRVGFIIGPYSKIGRVKKRLGGYKEALEANNIPYDDDLVIETEISLLEGKEAAKRLLSLPKPPSAIFAVSDMLAIGAMAAAREKGLNVPDDISIVGFDDIDCAAYLSPPLTTVRVPSEKIGELSAKALFEMIEAEKPTHNRHYSVDTELIIRESCSKFTARHTGFGSE